MTALLILLAIFIGWLAVSFGIGLLAKFAARSAGSADEDTWLSDFLAATDAATGIVAYCDGEECHLASELAELLSFNGFINIRYLRNGWTRWREGGFAVE